MKKCIIFSLVLSVLLSLTGCAPAPATATNPSGTDPVSEPVSRPAMAAVSMNTITQTASADDGTVIFKYTHQSMSLTLQDPDVADKVIVDFLSRFDSTQEAAQSLMADAKAAYTPNAEYWTAYLCSMLYDPVRIDPSVLSLHGTAISHSGGAHPDQAGVSANYDLLTGDVLTLASIMTPDATADDFCDLTLDALAEIKDELYLYDDYEATVRQRFSRDLSTDEQWYFTNEGICFYFSPYEIAAYASGIITAEIPYSKLTGIILDEYFPAEQAPAYGTVAAIDYKNSDVTQFDQITELIVDEGGQMVLLYTEGTVYDVRVEEVEWNEAGDEFILTHTVLATGSLSAGDAVMVESNIPDTMPKLRLSYRSGDRVITVYLSRNQKDGSVVLLGL